MGDFGWSPLRTVRADGWKFIEAPRPELYAVAGDPGEERDRIQEDQDRAAAPIFLYRSALPLQTFEGRDLNGDTNTNDITAQAYKFTGLNDDGTATFEDIGPCETVNCSRRAPFSQMNLRVSKSFRSYGTARHGTARHGTARIEAIAEVFNLFNAKNPALSLTSQCVNVTTGAQNPSFMQPIAYAGDFQQPEQRVGQIGFRLSF